MKINRCECGKEAVVFLEPKSQLWGVTCVGLTCTHMTKGYESKEAAINGWNNGDTNSF